MCVRGIRQPVLSSLHFIKLWNCNRSKEVREDDVPAVSAQQQHQCYWPRKKTLPRGDPFRWLLAALVHVANAEGHEAAAGQRHRGCRNDGDGAAGHADQEPQAHAQNDLGQLHHAGQGGTVDAFPSPVLPCLLPFLQLLALQTSTEQAPGTGQCQQHAALGQDIVTTPGQRAGQWHILLPFLHHRDFK